MGKLRVFLFGEIGEGNLWTFDTEIAGGIDGISHDGIHLGDVGTRDDGGIGEDDGALPSGDVCHGDMCHHPTLFQDTVFLVEGGTQEYVGVHRAFHQDIGISRAHALHGSDACVVAIDAFKLGDVIVLGSGNHLKGMCVGGVYNRHFLFVFIHSIFFIT